MLRIGIIVLTWMGSGLLWAEPAVVAAGSGAMSAEITNAEITSPVISFVARIDGHEIVLETYQRRLNQSYRETFYHGKPPEREFDAFRRNMVDQLINEFLFEREALRLGLTVDEALIQSKATKFEHKNANNPRWAELKDQWLPLKVVEWRAEALGRQLETLVRDLPVPEASEVRRYYEANRDKFTQPPGHRLSLILIGVAPSASGPDWQQAMDKAADLVRQLRGGADFAALAEIHSADVSAAQGGDMGFVHKGTVSDEIETALKELQPGDIAEPIQVLEGMAVVKLAERSAPRLQPFEAVEERAQRLLITELADLAWEQQLFMLRQNASIEVNESLF